MVPIMSLLKQEFRGVAFDERGLVAVSADEFRPTRLLNLAVIAFSRLSRGKNVTKEYCADIMVTGPLEKRFALLIQATEASRSLSRARGRDGVFTLETK